MKLPRVRPLVVVLVVVADALIGYLTVESLDSFTGARYSLPLTAILVDRVGLAPLLAGTILAAVAVAFAGGFFYWLSRHLGAPTVAVAAAPEKVGGPEGVRKDGAMKVGEMQFTERAEAHPFVDVVQLEGYPLNIYAAVTKEEGREGYTYVVIEPTLSEAEKARLEDLKRLLVDTLDVDLRSIDTADKAERYLSTKVKELSRKYGYKIAPSTMTKLLYYLNRDFIHLGKIEPLMRDKLIEDISCDGAGIPIYIWYRDYESIPTNIKFETEGELDTFVSKLAYSAGKHVSLAEPIVDASLADGSRLHLTYGKEITQKGSTFTIRKFKVDPLTIVDLIRYNTLSSDVAAYLWYLIEKKLALLIAGGTASGKSIPRDERVLVYRDGRPCLTPIGKLYDELATAKEARKENEYETLDCEGIETPAFNSSLKVEAFKVASVVRHPAPKSIYKVRTRSGREVRATGDHSLFTLVDGDVVPFPTSRISQGMFVAVPRTIPDSEAPVKTINLLEILADEEGVYVENLADYVKLAVSVLGEHEVASLLGVRPRDLRSGLRRGRVVARANKLRSLERAAGLPLSPEGLRIRPKTNGRTTLPVSLPVTRELARLMGYWAAEGMYQDGITLFQLDEETRADMIRVAYAALGIRGRPNPGDKTRIDFNSSVVLAAFKKLFGPGMGSGSKRIPELIFGQPNDFLAEFLKGYFTGDGCAGDTVEASTKSLELAQQLQYALVRFGIVARLSPKKVNGATYYTVSIYGKNNLVKFAERIGFVDKARRNALARAVETEVVPHTNLDTIPGISGLLKNALSYKTGHEKKELWSDWHSYWSPTKDKRMGRQTLADFVEETRPQDALRDRLLNLAYSDVFWDEVDFVEEQVCEDKFVYDLEVPGAQNFVGGSGGVFLHNTTSLNALSMFIAPGEKIVSVEDTPEINIPHENWIQSVTRGVGTAGEITMFDLIKASLRQRPDVLIVGEVRGEEAFTLFQSIATGHGGLATIHADSVEAVINRLTSEPMNIPRSLVGTTLDCIVMQLKIRLADRSVRRVVAVTEVVGHDPRTDEIVLNDAFKWDPVVDKFSFTGRSKLFDKITQKFGTRPEEIRLEIDGRKTFLDWLVAKNIRSHTEVSEQVKEFYAGPYAVINKAKVELEGLRA